MEKSLQEKLFQTYPKLFRQKDMMSCMSRGIECGDGWYTLIENLSFLIQHRINLNPHLPFPQVEFAQVKEKFGELTIYWEYNPEDYAIQQQKRTDFISLENVSQRMDEFTGWVSGTIAAAAQFSQSVCEVTGKPGKKRVIEGYHVTLCDEEYEAAKQRRANGGFIK